MKYDYVIFGASGFTGQFVVEFMANALKRDNDETSTWAISGRNEGKLRLVGLVGYCRILDFWDKSS